MPLTTGVALVKACVIAIASASLVAVAGVAEAAQPCGKAVISDWYDNGTIDQGWTCGCLRDAIDRLPDIRPPYSSAQDDFQRQIDLKLCEGSSEQVLRSTLVTPTAPAEAEESSDRWSFVLVVILAISTAGALAWWTVRRQQRES